MSWGSIDPSIHAWTTNEFEGEGAMRVPMWPARFIILIGKIFIAGIIPGFIHACDGKCGVNSH